MNKRQATRLVEMVAYLIALAFVLALPWLASVTMTHFDLYRWLPDPPQMARDG